MDTYTPPNNLDPVGFLAGSFGGNVAPYSNVTPFTHRDARTFEGRIEALVYWVNHDFVLWNNTEINRLVDEVNKQYQQFRQVFVDFTAATQADQAAFLANTKAAQLAFENVVNAAEALITEASTHVDEGVAAAQLSAEAAERWNAATEGLQDLAVTTLMGDKGSTTNTALYKAINDTTAVHNVKLYGAVGDGLADDTAAVQRAIDAGRTSGQPVLFPVGTYMVRKAANVDYMLKVYARTRLIGHGAGKARVKVASDAGNYRSVFAGEAVGTDLTGFSVTDLTIDQNNTGNPITATAPLFAGSPRYAVYATTGSDITVERCEFTDIDSVNTVALNGTAIRNAVVRNNLFSKIGQSVAGHDHSTVYVSGSGVTVTGNRFEGVKGGLGATAAIETHGNMQVVANNVIIDMYIGANITGVAAVGSDNIVVHDNIMRGVNIGITLWSMTPGTGLRNVAVHHNVINISHDPWVRGTSDYSRGIIIDPNMNVDMFNIAVHDNTIVFDATTVSQASELQSAGISLWTVSTTVKIRQLRVERNTVVGAYSCGLRLAVNTENSRVAGNEFQDVGSTPATTLPDLYKAGIVIVGTHTDLVVENNRAIDTRAAHVLTACVRTSVTLATRVAVRNNPAVCYDGTALPPVTTTAGTGKTFMLREAMDVYAAPGWARVGSSMFENTTGKTFVQTTAPDGFVWAERAL